MARDPDSDGDLDVITSDGSTATAYLLRNSGRGRLSRITSFPGEQISAMANGFAVGVDDLDGDRLLDLVVPILPGTTSASTSGRREPSRLSNSRYGAHHCFLDVSIADMNADGRLDVVGPACTSFGFTGEVGVTVLLTADSPAALRPPTWRLTWWGRTRSSTARRGRLH
jgi:FG-GAP-like repeat